MLHAKGVVYLFVSLLFFSCSKEQYTQPLVKPQGCDSMRFSFEEHIRPVFTSNCNFNECHAPGGKGNYDFTDYHVVRNRVEAGSIDYRMDLPDDDPQHMPMDMRLSSCDYFIIKTWIRQGYPEK